MKIKMVAAFVSLLVMSTALACVAGEEHKDADVWSRPVQLRRRFASFAQVIGDIERQVQGRIEVRGSVGGDNVVALVSGRPAREVVGILASTLGCQCSEAHGKLVVSGSKEEDARELRALLKRRYELIRELATECRTRAAAGAVTRKEATKRIERATRLLTGSTLDATHRRELENELAFLAKRPNADQQAPLLSVFARLAEKHREALACGATVRLSTSPSAGMAPLPSECASDLASSFLSSPEWASWLAKQSSQVSIRCQLRLRWQPQHVLVSVRSELVVPPPPGFAPGIERVLLTLPIAVPEIGTQQVGATPLSQRLGPVAAAPFNPVDPSTWQREVTLSDVVEAIHREHPDINLVGDALLYPPASLEANKTVRECLDTASAAAHTEWDWKPDGYVILKAVNRPEERQVALSAALLRETYARCGRPDGLRASDYCWLAGSLSDAQIDHFCDRLQWRIREAMPNQGINPVTLSRGRHEWRLLSTLSVSEIKDFFSGRFLWVSRLGIAQQAAVQTALNEDDDDPGGGLGVSYWTLAAVQELCLECRAADPEPGVTHGIPFQELRYFNPKTSTEVRSRVLVVPN